MQRSTFWIVIVVFLVCWIPAQAQAASADELELNGWRPFSPRDEIRPEFAINPGGGPDGKGGLVIRLDDREGLDGAWAKTFQIEGDHHYRVTAHRRKGGVANPRHHTYVELLFHDARGLAANGAEIIAMPIMGGHPALGKARAIENQIYLVTSTYSINDDWMQSGVWDLSGELLVRATEKDSVVVAEVDLAEQYFWRANMGEFKSRLRHERPAVPLPK
jgi:hypothetical protein